MASLRARTRTYRVSIHAPAWGATKTLKAAKVVKGCFNPRARVGRDKGPGGFIFAFDGFNPRARVGRDSNCLPINLVKPVSIHAPAWGATRQPQPARDRRPCFNPRARVGRDLRVPALGIGGLDVSIHAPAWGATSRTTRHFGWCACFNPRARVGRDLDHLRARTCAYKIVSIHAPAWGATKTAKLVKTVKVCFNPRARVGRDHCDPVRARPGRSFNPRARVGRD